MTHGLALAGLVVGCAGTVGDSAVEGDSDDTTTGDDTGVREPLDEYFRPVAVYFEGRFAIEPEAQTATGYLDAGVEQPISVDLMVASTAAFRPGADIWAPENWCRVRLSCPDCELPLVTWEFTDPAWFDWSVSSELTHTGFVLPPERVLAEADCPAWDPHWYGEDWLAGVTADFVGIGFGVGPLSGNMLQIYVDAEDMSAGSASIHLPEYAGALSLAFAFPIDDAGEIDRTAPLSPDDWTAGPVRAAYTVDGWILQGLFLLPEP